MEPPGAVPDSGVYTCTLMVISPDHWAPDGDPTHIIGHTDLTNAGLSLVSHCPVLASDWPAGSALPLSQLAMCGAHDDVITLVTDNYQLL